MRLPELGEIFEGRYRVESVLGEGGFAKVYSALETGSSQHVALKVLKRGQESTYDGPTRRRFEREARLLGQLRDPHTVRLFANGESSEGLLYMVFEQVPGRDLSEYLAGVGRLQPGPVVHILRQLLCSLREAHDLGLIHRDLKPENIRIFEADGDPIAVKLLDFGIARATDDGHPSITKTGELIGTPRYMSPEQITERPLSPASDIYSLGMVALELLVGRDALHGNRWGDQLDRLATGFVFSIPESERIGPALIAVIQRMSARKVEDRYPSAAAVLAALSSLDGPARPRHAPRAAAPPSSNNRYAPIALVAGVLLAVAAVVVTDQYGGDGSLPVTKRPAATLPPVPTQRAPPVDKLPSEQESADGCGREPGFDGVTNRTSLVGLNEVEWTVRLPNDYDPNHRHPILVMFRPDHSKKKEGAAEFVQTSGFGATADEQQFIILVPADAADARAALEDTRETLCTDIERVFAFGQGLGGGVALAFACGSAVAAVATSAYREQVGRGMCEKSVPYLHLAHLEDGYHPIAGGGQPCTLRNAISLNVSEDRWRERNGCGPDEQAVPSTEGARCYTWDGCRTPLVYCQVNGGRFWPGQSTLRGRENCDGEAIDYPFAETIWAFFVEQT